MDDTGRMIKAAAIDRADKLFEQLVGQPHNRRARQWRHGSKGSFMMHMSGPKRGLWKDWESGDRRRDILDFVAVRHLGLNSAKDDFGGTLKATAALLGIAGEMVTPEQAAALRIREAARAATRAAEEAAEAQSKAKLLNALQARAQPLHGSPAETYLRSRGITRMPDNWSFLPSVLGLLVKHPHRPALVAWGTDENGTVHGGQRVLIMPDGSKAPEDARKPSFSTIGGYPARLPADAPDGPLFVAEGPETALTIWQATGCETWAVFGASNFQAAPLPTDRTVILCPDADAPDSAAGKSFAKACAHHAARGVRLYVAHSGLPAGSKGDLNDVLMTSGIAAVRAAIGAAVPFTNGPALPTVTEARAKLAEAVGGFFDAVAEWHSRDWWDSAVDMVEGKPAPAHLLAAGLGLGKTTATARAMVERIRHLRAKGDDAAAAVMLVPMHRLGEQVAAELRTMAPELTVAVIRGAEAEDPAEAGTTACKRLEVYRHRSRHLLDPCHLCPLMDSCEVQKGKRAKADIYLQAHGALGGKPAPATKWRGQRLDHVAVDESPLSALLIGVEAPRQLGLAAWKAAKLPSATGDAADLTAYRGRLATAAEACAGGPLTRSALLAAGLTAEDAKAAAGLEWARQVKGDDDAPDLPENLTLLRAVGIWHAVAEVLTGNAETGGRLHVMADPELGPAIRHRGLRTIKPAWKAAPMLMLDATADETVTAALIQRPIARTDEIRAAEPMLILIQDADFTGSKALLVDSPTDKGRKACKNNRRRLEVYMRRLARQHAPARVLLVSNKGLLELLELPDNVVTAHFNGLRGLNDFQDVAAAVIVGRPQPQESTLAAMAGAIFGREVGGRINFRGTADRLVLGGMTVTGRASVHDDADAQRLLHLIRDAEVMQAVGRLRAVNRTAPVSVIVLSDAVLPMPVELAPVWRDDVRKVDPLEMMLEESGIAFISPAHAAKAFPARWKSLNAAKYALGDATGEKTSYGSLYDEFSLVAEVSYRLPRARENVVALVDLRRHPNPKALLEHLFGPLAHYAVVESVPSPAETAVNAACKILKQIKEVTGKEPKVTLKIVETPFFVPHYPPPDAIAAEFRRRGMVP